jgi:hypothetical protein
VSKKYPTPAELADYLEGEGIRKAKTKFGNDKGGFCCLGHYANLCGLEFDPEQKTFLFGRPELRWWSSEKPFAALPKNHWLLKWIKDTNGGPRQAQDALAVLNDTSSGFDKVIAQLRQWAEHGVK